MKTPLETQQGQFQFKKRATQEFIKSLVNSKEATTNLVFTERLDNPNTYSQVFHFPMDKDSVITATRIVYDKHAKTTLKACLKDCLNTSQNFKHILIILRIRATTHSQVKSRKAYISKSLPDYYEIYIYIGLCKDGKIFTCCW